MITRKRYREQQLQQQQTTTTKKRSSLQEVLSTDNSDVEDLQPKKLKTATTQNTPKSNYKLPVRNNLEYAVFNHNLFPPDKKCQVIDLTTSSSEEPNKQVKNSSSTTSSSAALLIKRKKDEPLDSYSKDGSFFDYCAFPPIYRSYLHNTLDKVGGPKKEKNHVIPEWDDENGHYLIKFPDLITSRYETIKLLGQGTFGKVLEANDKKTHGKVAIKIIRNIPKYRDASKIEIMVLNEIKKADPENKKRCISLLECFDFRDHICMVFEKLSLSMYDYLKENSFHPFSISHIRQFAYQILEAVEFLHRLKLIHTDLKPENLMLINSESTVTRINGKKRYTLLNTDIQLIDFGSAIFEDDYHSTIVSTRHYRAPEIILCMGWSYPCDIWSVGCILVELFTGSALFQTHDNLEHLAMMEVVLGPFSKDIVRDVGASAEEFFNKSNTLDYPNSGTSKSSKKYVKKMKPLSKILGIKPNSAASSSSSSLMDAKKTRKDEELESFYDLLERMLVYEPESRINATQALKHDFFKT